MRYDEIQKELRHGTPQHTRILAALEARLALSKEFMQKRYSQWAENESAMQAYIPTSELDAARKAKRKEGKPDYSTLVVPYGYAQLMTAHTYWASVFLSRTPIYQYTARHGEPMDKVLSVEAIMDYQLHAGKHLPALFSWGKDKLTYGMGFVGYHWDTEEIVTSRYENRPKELFGVPLPGTSERKKVTEVLRGYQGNKLFNIRPQDAFPDPRVTLREFQKGEFFAYFYTEAWSSVMDTKERGGYFNIEVVKRNRTSAQSNAWSAADLDREQGHSDTVSGIPDHTRTAIGQDIPDAGYLEGHQMYVRLRPIDWGLGKGTRSELWAFSFVKGVAITSARPLGCVANRFPADIMEFDIGGYSMFKRSLIEYAQPLENVMTWLFNTHFYNVRKELNGTIIYDPLRVSEKAVLDNEPGKRIPLLPSAFGTDVRQAMHQLSVADVTRTHMQDVQFVRMIADLILGINENIMGQVHQGGRKTATEVRHASSFGVNRMKNHVEWDSAVGFSPLAQSLLMNTQQYMDDERQYRIAGDLSRDGQPAFRNVSPEQIAGFYDFVAVDGTMPVDKFAQANLFKELLAQFRGLPPQMVAQWDITSIISHIMQLGGATNVNRFKIQVQGPEQIARQAQAGNIVPAGGPPGAAPSPTAAPGGGSLLPR